MQQVVFGTIYGVLDPPTAAASDISAPAADPRLSRRCSFYCNGIRTPPPAWRQACFGNVASNSATIRKYCLIALGSRNPRIGLSLPLSFLGRVERPREDREDNRFVHTSAPTYSSVGTGAVPIGAAFRAGILGKQNAFWAPAAFGCSLLLAWTGSMTNTYPPISSAR